MSENVQADSAPVVDATAPAAQSHCESPPLAPQPARGDTPDLRVKLLQRRRGVDAVA